MPPSCGWRGWLVHAALYGAALTAPGEPFRGSAPSLLTAGEFGRNPVVRAMVRPPAEVDRCQWQGPYEERFVPWFDHFVEDVLQGGPCRTTVIAAV
ncbi:hypothetical protein GCM10010430_50340 [Kitasatospora cystarginea]|uniref:Uncharacterized protein n=1 Tax=Kitasatospora cystarginea TaxID=58350 RepID=A0ABN3EJ68_9ACTN